MTFLIVWFESDWVRLYWTDWNCITLMKSTSWRGHCVRLMQWLTGSSHGPRRVKGYVHPKNQDISGASQQNLVPAGEYNVFLNQFQGFWRLELHRTSFMKPFYVFIQLFVFFCECCNAKKNKKTAAATATGQLSQSE